MLCIGIKTVHAQKSGKNNKTRLSKFPLFNVSHLNYSNAKVDVDEHSFKYRTEEYNVKLQTAIPLKSRKTYLFNSLSYVYSKYFSEFNQHSDALHRFHTLNYNVGIIRMLPKYWTFSVNLSPILSSDFKDKINSDDFRYNVSVMAQKRANEYFEYGIGLGYASYVSYVEGGFVVPFFSMTYKNNRNTTRMIFPSFIHQSYAINPNTDLGFRIAMNGSLKNMAGFDNSGNLDLNRISESGVLIGPDLQKKVWGDFYLNVNCGVSVSNRIQFQDNSLKKEMEVDAHQKFYFGIGLVLLK